MKLLLILTLFLSCCVHTSPETDFVRDPELVELMEDFIDDYEATGLRLPDHPPLVSLEFVSVMPEGTSKSAIAVCTFVWSGENQKTPSYSEIRVLSAATNNKYKLKRVIYHELFHCLGMKNHNPNYHPDVEGFFTEWYQPSAIPFDKLLEKYFTRDKIQDAPNIKF